MKESTNIKILIEKACALGEIWTSSEGGDSAPYSGGATLADVVAAIYGLTSAVLIAAQQIALTREKQFRESPFDK